MRAVVFSCVFAFVSSTGCSSQDGSVSPPEDAGHSSDASPIVTGDSAVADTAPRDSGPKYCWLGHPTDTSAVTCDECSQVACKDNWGATWGAGWASDDFTGGACAKDAACLCTCDETDLVCTQNCDITFEDSPCRTAKQALRDCEAAKCSVPCGRTF